MLDHVILEQIRRREEARRRQQQPQELTLELPKPPIVPKDVEHEDIPDRGVVVLDIL